ncbi:polysaccharide deacetylase family protein [Pseudoneobacillus sp. C159]
MKKLLVCLVGMLIWTSSSAEANVYKRFKFEKTGQVFWEVKTKQKLVALTFDDGPDPIFTPQILDALAKYDAKATFFVIGAEAEKYPEIIRREAKEGHEIANHTYRHHFRDHFQPHKLIDELQKTSKVIEEISGQTPSLYRPHSGYYNENIVNTAVNNGYRVILWSWHQDTKDWKRPGVGKITQNVVSDTKPGDIVIFHDAGGDRKQTVKAVENILKILYQNGYKCVTVSEILQQSDSIFTSPQNIVN